MYVRLVSKAENYQNANSLATRSILLYKSFGDNGLCLLGGANKYLWPPNTLKMARKLPLR
jgi:hypothetical protein